MRRLLEDGQLPAQLRGDLLRARAAGQDYPTAAKLMQLRAALAVRPDPAPAASARGGAALKQLRALHPGWKLSALLVLAGGAEWLTQPSAPAPDRGALPALQAGPALQLEPALELQHAPKPEPRPPLAAAAPEGPVPRLADNADITVTHASPSAADPTASSNSSRREIAQLIRLRALVERNPAAALRLAKRSEREFPQGLLREERQALAIVALTKTGAKVDARQSARRYFARYPHSPMRELIQGALQ